MNAPRYGADDGSFGRSVGGSAARGVVLVAIVLAIGILIAVKGIDNGGTAVAGGPSGTGGGTSNSTAAPGQTTVPGQTTLPGGATSSTVPATTAPPASVSPTTIIVRVANGTRKSGAAKSVTDKLNAKNYKTLKAVDAINKATEVTTVFYIDGQQAAAQQVAADLGYTNVERLPAVAPIAEVADAMVIVVLGTDTQKTTG